MCLTSSVWRCVLVLPIDSVLVGRSRAGATRCDEAKAHRDPSAGLPGCDAGVDFNFAPTSHWHLSQHNHRMNVPLCRRGAAPCGESRAWSFGIAGSSGTRRTRADSRQQPLRRTGVAATRTAGRRRERRRGWLGGGGALRRKGARGERGAGAGRARRRGRRAPPRGFVRCS